MDKLQQALKMYDAIFHTSLIYEPVLRAGYLFHIRFVISNRS